MVVGKDQRTFKLEALSVALTKPRAPATTDEAALKPHLTSGRPQHQCEPTTLHRGRRTTP